MKTLARTASRMALALGLAAALPAAASAQDSKDAPKWDVAAPPGMKVRQIPITVDEGTWMNLDVSPDGRTLVFDLLGDIYTLPITGGTPTRISEGLPYETQPRFSPDGRRIAFTSDRGGGDNIWIMNRDGSDKRQLTQESFRLMNQPSWSPDGRYIIAKKHFTTQRSLGTGEVWMYHVSGGDGVLLVKRPSEQHQKELGEPIFAPNGQHIYFTRNTTPGPIFEYAQDSNTQLFAIERYDLETGKSESLIGGEGGAVRPTPSPDGRKIAYVRREATQPKLYIRDLATGEDRKLYDALDMDVQETWAVTGVYPNMAWTPDSASIVFWAGGRLNRVELSTGKSTVIPFKIADTRGVIDPPQPAVAVAPDTFETRMPRGGNVSPDGRSVVFETLGKLWIKPMAGGKPRRLTNDEAAMEAYPSWSTDGRTLVYVRWTDAGLGEVRTIAASGGRSRAITPAGHYARPRFSPDGRMVVFEKDRGGYLSSPRGSAEPGVYRVAASGGGMTRITEVGANPQFGLANDRVFVMEGDAKESRLVSLDLNGEARRVHARGELVNDYRVSPDGRYLAFRQNYQAFVTPLLPGAQEVTLTTKGGALPVVKVSGDGADWIHWSQGGKRLNWSLGPTVFSADRAAMFAEAPPAKDAKPAAFEPPRTGVSLSMQIASDKPTGRLAIVGARVVTMKGPDGGVIDDGVVLIERDRIKAVGRRGEVAIPAGTPTFDATGKTLIPGLIDAHAHG
ncbi:MAG: PD40 domain-containing protein, partial [Phenylobacterium sp.]|uniref:amidohydrolase n=1 Tax=Phenylobacterium sp. TaxID=1871053 RepID=UPI0025F91427